MKFNKNGSLAFSWIYGLTFLFCIGLLYIMFNQALTVHFVPVIESTIPDDYQDAQIIIDKNTEWMSYWTFIPFMVVFFILTWWFVAAIRGGQERDFP